MSIPTNDISALHSLYLQCSGVCTDTRNIELNSMFFCLKGANFDGNTFADLAVEKGAKYVVIDNPDFAMHSNCILVNDVLKALQALAMFHRQALNPKVIGITGTNGKTTTKELINAVLSTQYRTHATRGNLNNHIGVPLTLLSMPVNTEIAIIEMGANHLFEIKELCDICLPNFGIITSIGKAHLEGFGSIEGIIKTKKELYDFIQANGGRVFVPAENDLLMDLSKSLTRVCYGMSTNADVHGKLLKNDGLIKLEYRNIEIQSQLVGEYNFGNIMASISMGEFFEISIENIQDALQNYKPQNQRSQLLHKGTNTFILDAYNANPTSMELALKSLENIEGFSKSVILGDMLELGKESIAEHQYIIHLLEKMNLQNIVLIGPIFNALPHKFKGFSDSQKAKEYFLLHPWQNQFVLIKGSRGIQVEKVLDAFLEE